MGGRGRQPSQHGGTRAQIDQVLIGLAGHGSPGSLQEGLDVTASKALDPPDRMTRQVAPPHHPIDGHRRQLQQFRELPDSVKFRLGIIS